MRPGSGWSAPRATSEGTADTLDTLAEIALDDADAGKRAVFAREAMTIAGRRLPLGPARRDDHPGPGARRGSISRRGPADPGQRPRVSDRIGQTLAMAQCLRVGGCLAVGRGRRRGSRSGCSRPPRPGPLARRDDEPVEQDLAAGLAEARAALGERADRQWTLGAGMPLPRCATGWTSWSRTADGALARAGARSPPAGLAPLGPEQVAPRRGRPPTPADRGRHRQRDRSVRRISGRGGSAPLLSSSRKQDSSRAR